MTLFNNLNKKEETSVFMNQVNDTIIKEQQYKSNKSKKYYLINTKNSNIIGGNRNFETYYVLKNRYIVLIQNIPEFETDSRMDIKDIEMLKQKIFDKFYKDKNILYDTDNEQITLNFNKRITSVSDLTFQTSNGLYHTYTDVNNQLIEYIFENIETINQNYHIVKKDEKFGIFNPKNGIVIPIEYEEITFEKVKNITLCYTLLNNHISCYKLASDITKIFEFEDVLLNEIKGYIDKNKNLYFKIRNQEIEFTENTWKFKNEVLKNELKKWLIKDIKDILLDEDNNFKILYNDQFYLFLKGKWVKEDIEENNKK